MKPLYLTALSFIATMLFACQSGPLGFGEKNLHDKYGDKLKKAGLQQTAIGRAWFAEAHKALSQPLPVSLPYKLVGYFAEDKPTAIGLQFNATRGEKLNFYLKKNPDSAFVIYADLWQPQNSEEPSLLISVDSANSRFSHEVKETGNYILRLQPELLATGEYELSISVGASLAFPSSSGSIQSYWGAARGSSRRHEGIDIFAPKGTPVVAAEDGRITRVGENNLGGKIIFMRVGAGRNISLYYAHLDTQLVKTGQRVNKGDTLGIIGNTGNARTTPPHLHFGIYTSAGAVDPLPFVNPDTKEPGPVSFPPSSLHRFVRLTANQKISNGKTLERNQVLFAIAAGADSLIAQLPEGEKMLLPATVIQQAADALSVKKLKNTTLLLSAPIAGAPAKKRLIPAVTVAVLGYHNNYVLIKVDEFTGWLPYSSL